MADQNPFGQSSFPPAGGPPGGNQPPKPSSVPPPPPPPITVRTMGSDIKSMQSSGGTPMPQQVKPEELRNFAASADEPIFSPGNPMSPSPLGVEKSSSGWIKVLIWIVGIIIVLGGLGFVGYTYVYPAIFGQKEVVEEPPTQQQPPPVETPQPQVRAHTSFFKTPPVQSNALSLTEVSVASIRAAFIGIPGGTNATGTLKEVTFSDTTGQIESSKILSALAPSLAKDEISKNFEDDFTAYVYYEKGNAWPGYIFKLKQNALLIEAQNLVKKMETAPINELKNFFTTDPKTPAPGTKFNDGTLANNPAKYLPFSQSGASLNFAWLGGNYFLIGTNYAGIKDAANRLGF